MQAYGLSEDELFMLIAGKLDPAALAGPDAHLAIARALAAGISANNHRVQEQQRVATMQRLGKTQEYDRLSQSIDCY